MPPNFFTGAMAPTQGINPILQQGLAFGLSAPQQQPEATTQPVQPSAPFMNIPTPTAQPTTEGIGFEGTPPQEPVGTNTVLNPTLPSASEGFDTSAGSTYLENLGQRESGGDYTAVNTLGYAGKYQFGKAALQDTGYKDKDGQWTGKDGINSQKDWLANSEVQESAQQGLIKKQKGYLKSKGALDFIGKTVDGVKITEEGLLSATHLLGAGGVNKWLNNPSSTAEDAYGTSIKEYLTLGQ